MRRSTRTTVWLAAIAWGCGPPTAAEPAQRAAADRQAYVAAVASPTDPNACAPIVDAAVQAECLAFVGRSLALAGRPSDARPGMLGCFGGGCCAIGSGGC